MKRPRQRGPVLKVCAEPKCPEFADLGQSLCPVHLAERGAWADRHQRRPRASSGWEEARRAARVIKRDGGVCHVCGLPGATVADHVVALALGGPDDEANLRPIHAQPCHAAKTAAEAREGARRAASARRQ